MVKKRYILHPENLKVGDTIYSGKVIQLVMLRL
jgi:ribosomal protein L2